MLDEAMTLTSMQENQVWGQILWRICGPTPIELQYLLVCLN